MNYGPIVTESDSSDEDDVSLGVPQRIFDVQAKSILCKRSYS